MDTATPGQTWDYYKRLNLEATLELLPISVSGYAKEIPDPGDEKLKELFEKYKNRLEDPASPEPGFRLPKKIAMEYVKADYGTVADPQAVPRSEVEAYYEEHKEEYRRMELPELEKKPSSGDSEKASEPDGEVAPKPTGEEAEPGKAETAGEAETGKQTTGEPESSESAPTPAGQPDAASETENSDQEAAPGEAGSGAETEESSSAPSRSPFRFAGFQPEEPQQTTAQEQGAGPDDSAAGQAAPDAPESPADSVGQADGEPAGAEPGEEAIAEEEMEAIVDAVAGEPKSEYLPLQGAIEDQIRSTLARERVQKVLDALRDEMQRFHNDWIVYDNLPAEDRGQPPTRPDLAALAKKHGLGEGAVHRTGLISAWEASQLDIAQSRVGGRRFLDYAFGSSLVAYKPEVSQDVDGNYVFWKLGKLDNVEETIERIPEFEEVRGQVLACWQKTEGRVKALAAAKDMAKLAEEGGGSLKDTFPERTVVETDPFTWNTEVTAGLPWDLPRPEISEIKRKLEAGTDNESEQPDAVDTPGEEFMRAVFQPETEDGGVRDIKVGDVGVAMNQPRTTVYVYRVTELSPSGPPRSEEGDVYQDLRDSFLKEKNFARYRYVGFGEEAEAYRSWQEQLRASVDFKWEREPQTRGPE
jgi:hypothetical protein